MSFLFLAFVAFMCLVGAAMALYFSGIEKSKRNDWKESEDVQLKPDLFFHVEQGPDSIYPSNSEKSENI